MVVGRKDAHDRRGCVGMTKCHPVTPTAHIDLCQTLCTVIISTLLPYGLWHLVVEAGFEHQEFEMDASVQ